MPVGLLNKNIFNSRLMQQLDSGSVRLSKLISILPRERQLIADELRGADKESWRKRKREKRKDSNRSLCSVAYRMGCSFAFISYYKSSTKLVMLARCSCICLLLLLCLSFCVCLSFFFRVVCVCIESASGAALDINLALCLPECLAPADVCFRTQETRARDKTFALSLALK